MELNPSSDSFNIPDGLDLSSIEDRDDSKHSQQIQVQQIHPQGLDDIMMRENMREILMTAEGEKQYSQSEEKNHSKCMESSGEQGAPFKGSFLLEMEKLGKTMSFQSIQYNIYQPTDSRILDSQPSQTIITAFNEKLDFMNIGELEKLYILDFKKSGKKQKMKQIGSSSKKYESKHKSKKVKNQLTFIYSSGSALKSQQSIRNTSSLVSKGSKLTKNRGKSKSSTRNRQHRKSDTLTFLPKGKYSQPLKKIGVNSANSDVFKSKKSQGESLIEKRKKIAIKFKL